ncbi:hypothetical protein VCBJG01_1238 [Vibrio cholerae BJG-01]|nr:hypothetical protein VCBJG01_1238 [Vibrio cholerae BJG-01]
MLGHDLGGILAVYNKHDWLNEQKDAYENFSNALFNRIKIEQVTV